LLDNATKLIAVISAFCVVTWLFVLGETEPSRVYELAYFVVSAIVVGALIRRFWPDSKRLSPAELRPYLIPLGWGGGIGAIPLMAGLLAERWKLIEYLLFPVPPIALILAIKNREAIRRALSRGLED